jgi:hypothetical protein
MKKSRCLLICCLAVVSFRALGQTADYTAVQRPELIPWEQFSSPDKRFIVAGEAHHVSVIFPFQLSHLHFLVTKGFRHLVWEVPFSFSYIAEEYISTGNDSLLRHLAWAEEDLFYWKSVYKINQALSEGDKLHIWGIDHELGKNTGGTYRAKIFWKALQLMAASRGDMPPSLLQEYRSLQKDSAGNTFTDIKHRLQKVQDLPEVVSFFGERLPYFKILVNRLDHYKVSRNDEMLEAFKEICSSYHLDSTAKFLGRFGWGHINKSYKKSMSWLLENDPSSPVRGSTFVIGVQYLNCTSAVRIEGLFLENDGIVYDRKQKKRLLEIDQMDASPIKIFGWPSDKKPVGWAEAADVLIVFSGFPGVTLLKKRD